MSQNLELVKIINKKKTFVNGKGKEVPSYTYFLCFNGQMIPFKPLFNDGYIKLDLLSRIIIKE